MKKIIAIIILCSLILCSCGNMSIGIGNYNFKKVHVDTHHYSGCLTLEKWYEEESRAGVEVKTEEAGAIFLSEGTYSLVADECPFCEVNK